MPLKRKLGQGMIPDSLKVEKRKYLRLLAHASIRNNNTFTPVRIRKRPSNSPSLVDQNKVVSPIPKKTIVDTHPTNTNSPRIVSYVFIAKSDGMIFKPQQLPKPNVPSKIENKE